MIFRTLIVLALTSFSLLQAEEAQFNFESLKTLIIEKKIKSIDKLIEELPDDLKKNYTLMKTSRSLHEASYEKPRAILFGNTGNLIITFNSDSSQKGGDAVEIMEFIKTPKPRFEMREIAFDPQEKKSPVISKSNPEKCLVCHGNPPKPIWGDYDEAGSGVYGASLEGLTDEEKEQLAAFKKLAEHHPRYSKLHLPKDDQYFPYSGSKEQLIKTLPNVRLTSLLLNHLVENQAAKIKRDPFIFTYLYAGQCSFEKEDQKYIEALTAFLKSRAVHGEVSGVGHEISSDPEKMKKYFAIDSVEGPLRNHFFYPPKIREAFKIKFDDLSLEFEKGKKAFSESGFFHDSKTMFRNHLLDSYVKRHPSLAKAMGGDFKENFSKQLEGTDPLFIEALSSSGGFFHEYDQPRLCQELKPFMQKEMDRFRASEENECHSETAQPPLESKAIKDIELISKKIQLTRTEKFQKIMVNKNCVECHDRSGVLKIGPEMPLLNELELARVLKQDKNFYTKIEKRLDPATKDSMRMPLGQPPLSKEEREEILEYLKGLMN